MEEEREIRTPAEHDGEPRIVPPAVRGRSASEPDPALARVETAVAPIIRAESVHVPTPAWGALAAGEAIGPAVPDPAAMDPATATGESVAEERRLAWLSWTGMLLAVGAAVVHGVAIGVEAEKAHQMATVLAWIAIGASLAAVVAGAAGIVRGRNRGIGIAAVVLGALANPWLLLQALTVLQG